MLYASSYYIIINTRKIQRLLLPWLIFFLLPSLIHSLEHNHAQEKKVAVEQRRTQEKTIAVAAVQFEVKEEYYRDIPSFKRAVEGYIRAVKEKCSEVDLIIFPEYINVFLALPFFREEYGDRFSLTELYAHVLRQYRTPYQARIGFLKYESEIKQVMDQIWGGLAKHYSTVIVAGTYFAGEYKKYRPDELRNRLVVYGPKGKQIYEQDKAFLTSFELERLGLMPGSPWKAQGFLVHGIRCVLTICRDAYFNVWEDLYDEGKLWIDIKANGASFDQDVKRSFKRSLPERLAYTPVPYGVTVCLTGSFFDLFWEGKSTFYAKNSKGEVINLSCARDHKHGDIIIEHLNYGSENWENERP